MRSKYVGKNDSMNKLTENYELLHQVILEKTLQRNIESLLVESGNGNLVHKVLGGGMSAPPQAVGVQIIGEAGFAMDIKSI